MSTRKTVPSSLLYASLDQNGIFDEYSQDCWIKSHPEEIKQLNESWSQLPREERDEALKLMEWPEAWGVVYDTLNDPDEDSSIWPVFEDDEE